MKFKILVLLLAIGLVFAVILESENTINRHVDEKSLMREELIKLLENADSSVVNELHTIVTRSLGAAASETPSEEASGSSHVSLFGSVSHIEPIIGTVSLIIIIGAVLFLQSIFAALHALTAETSFTTMVVRIENELMIVGCSAFIFKIIVNTTSFLNEEWALALEFAEILIPILSFCYCGIGILLIIMALRQCDLWSKAYNLKLIELVDVYLINVKSFMFRMSWKPMNAITDQMEFRIFHNLFCEMFKIQRDAFAFDEYVHRVFEKFVMTVIEIRPIDWFIVMVVVLINLGRKKLKLDYNECHEHDTGCDEESTLKLFTIVGSVLYGITCVFVYVSRSLEFKIMAKRGVSSWRHYSDYLQHMEVNADRAAEKRRLNVEELKAAVLIGKLHLLKKQKSVRRFEDRATDALMVLRRFATKVHGWTTRRKLHAADSPEAIEAIMKLALRGSSVKFDPIDPEPYEHHDDANGEEGEGHHNGQEMINPNLFRDHGNPYVHTITSLEKATQALDGTESELYVDMLRVERRRSMQANSGSDRKYSTMTGSNRSQAASQAPTRKNTSAVPAPVATPSVPPLNRAGGLPAQIENENLRQHLAEIKQSNEPNHGNGLSSVHSSYENLHEIDLEAQNDNNSVTASADVKIPSRSVPTVYSTKVKVAPPLDKRDLDEKSVGNSSDLSDDDHNPLVLSQSEEFTPNADHVMNFDDAASITSTVVTSSKQVPVPNRSHTPPPSGAGLPVLSKQLSNKLILPKIDNGPAGALTLKPLPPIAPTRKRTLLGSLMFGFIPGIAEEAEDEVSAKNSFIRSNRFQQMFMSTNSKVAATTTLPEDEIEAAERPDELRSMGESRAISARGSTIMATGSFLKKQFNNLGTNMFRRLRNKNLDSTDAAVLEDLAAEHHTSVEKHGTEVMDVFLFSRPEIYFECVQLIIIIIALYIALWLTNFIATAHTPFWIIISLLPGVLSTINFIYIIKTAALLKAVYKVDFDAVLEVIEQTEGVKLLSEQLRSKVLERLIEQGDPHAELQKLFHEIDINHNNSLSRQEFELFMNTLGLSFSRKKWQQIYKEIDRNFDNCISFQEFYLFLYPEHDAAMALELKRLKVIAKRVFKNNKLLNMNQHKIEGRKRTMSREESIERIKERQMVHRKAVVCLDEDKVFG